MPNSCAISQACSPPHPPKATSAKSRGSCPRSTDTRRMARSMLALATRRMPWAARTRLMPSCCAMESTAVAARSVFEVHLAADQLVRRDAPQHDVRVRHRGARAFAVTSRSRIGARAFRPHAQQSAFIHARDGAAARAHRVDVEHGHAHREARRWTLPAFRAAGRRTG